MTEPSNTESDIEIPLNVYREASIRLEEWDSRRDMFIMGFKGDKLLAYCCTLLAMGKFEILGCDNGEQLARRFCVSKQAVSLIVRRFKATMDLD